MWLNSGVSMSKTEQFLEQCIVLDTETTSDDFHKAEIIESGFVLRNNGVWDVYQDLHRPVNGPIPPKIQSICYITNQMVSESQPFSESTAGLQSVIDVYKAGYVVAHNYSYDQRVLENNGIVLPKNSICTWRIAKKLFMDSPDITETNLPYLRFALELDVPLEYRCHRAGYDSLITGHLLESMIKLMESYGLIDETADLGTQIMEYSNAPIIHRTMPFGKYKNVAMSEIPTSYWQWAMKNTDWFNPEADSFDPDLLESINAALEGQ